MTQFFVPGANSYTTSEQIYGEICSQVGTGRGADIKARRVYRLAYEQDGMHYEARVGEVEPRGGEMVVAILESDVFLVCQRHRGVEGLQPVVVDPGSVRYLEEFD